MKSNKLLKKLKVKSEIIIVDDGCPQNQDIMQKKFLKKSRVVKLYFIKKIWVMALRLKPD